MQIGMVHQVVPGTTMYNPKNDRHAPFFNGKRDIPENASRRKKTFSMDDICKDIGMTPLTRTVDGVVTNEAEKWRPREYA